MKITVVGVGGLGSHAVQFLRNQGSITVVDFDRVEAKNTMSQFHAIKSLRQLKVAAIRQLMQMLWGTRVEVRSSKLVANNVEALLHGADLVVDCLDNTEGRKLVQAFVRAHEVPCVHAAISADSLVGRVVWDDKFIVDEDGGAEGATCEDGEALPMLAMVAAHLALSVQSWTSGAQVSLHITKKNVSVL